MVKQEMARLNTDIFEISELKWMGMGECNSDDHYIYYCGQEPHRRNRVALIINRKSLKCSTWVQHQKRLMISVHFQGKPFNVTVIHVYAPTTNAKEAKVDQLYEDLKDLLELTPEEKMVYSSSEVGMQK